MKKLDSILKNKDIKFSGPYSQSYGFSNCHVRCELDDKEVWVLKNLLFQIVVLEKILKSP